MDRVREKEEHSVPPAVLVGQSVQGDGSLSTGTFEETLHSVVPPKIVMLLHAAIRRLEVGVATLEARDMRSNE